MRGQPSPPSWNQFSIGSRAATVLRATNSLLLCASAVHICPLYLQNKLEEPLQYSWGRNGKSSHPGSFFFWISVKFTMFGKLRKLSSGNWKGKTITYNFSVVCKSEINQEITQQGICETRSGSWMWKAFNLCPSGFQFCLLELHYFTRFVRCNHLYHLKNFLAVFHIPLCMTWITLHNALHLPLFSAFRFITWEFSTCHQWSPHCHQWDQSCHLVISTSLLPHQSQARYLYLSHSHSAQADRDPHVPPSKGQAQGELPIATMVLSIQPLCHNTHTFPSLLERWQVA